MDYHLGPLSETFRKADPACSSCGYDALHILRLETIERLFCDRCLMNALLDAINFQCSTPSAL